MEDNRDFFILSVNNSEELFSRGQGYKGIMPVIVCTLVPSCFSKSYLVSIKSGTALSEPEIHWLDCADFLILLVIVSLNHQTEKEVEWHLTESQTLLLCTLSLPYMN